MTLEKREKRLEVRVSFYEGQGFGTTRELVRTQVYDGDTPVGGPSEEWRKVEDFSALNDILGHEIGLRRNQLDALRLDFDMQMRDAARDAALAIAAKDAQIETVAGRLNAVTADLDACRAELQAARAELAARAVPAEQAQ